MFSPFPAIQKNPEHTNREDFGSPSQLEQGYPVTLPGKAVPSLQGARVSSLWRGPRALHLGLVQCWSKTSGHRWGAVTSCVFCSGACWVTYTLFQASKAKCTFRREKSCLVLQRSYYYKDKCVIEPFKWRTPLSLQQKPCRWESRFRSGPIPCCWEMLPPLFRIQIGERDHLRGRLLKGMTLLLKMTESISIIMKRIWNMKNQHKEIQRENSDETILFQR